MTAHHLGAAHHEPATRPASGPTSQIIAVDGNFAVIRYTTSAGATYRVRVLARHQHLARRTLPTIAASLRHVAMLRDLVAVAAHYNDGDMVGRFVREIAEFTEDAAEMAAAIGMTPAEVLF